MKCSDLEEPKYAVGEHVAGDPRRCSSSQQGGGRQWSDDEGSGSEPWAPKKTACGGGGAAAGINRGRQRSAAVATRWWNGPVCEGKRKTHCRPAQVRTGKGMAPCTRTML